jgi:hypothetical protein
MALFSADRGFDWHLVNRLHNAVPVSLRNHCGSISSFRQKSNPGDHPWGKVRQLVVSGDSAEALLKPFELFPLNYKYPRVRVAADTHGLNHQQHVLTRGRSLVSEEGDFNRRYL